MRLYVVIVFLLLPVGNCGKKCRQYTSPAAPSITSKPPPTSPSTPPVTSESPSTSPSTPSTTTPPTPKSCGLQVSDIQIGEFIRNLDILTLYTFFHQKSESIPAVNIFALLNPLAMIYMGCSGEAAREIEKFVFVDIDRKSLLPNSRLLVPLMYRLNELLQRHGSLSIKNSVQMQKPTDIKQEYLNSSRECLSVAVSSLPVMETTDSPLESGEIGDISFSTSIGFNGKLKTIEAYEDKTKSEFQTFHGGKKLLVPYVTLIGNFHYASTEDAGSADYASALAIDYENNGYFLLFYVPGRNKTLSDLTHGCFKEGGIYKLETQINPSLADSCYNEIRTELRDNLLAKTSFKNTQAIQVSIPKFDTGVNSKHEVHLYSMIQDPLPFNPITTIFSSKADFSKLSNGSHFVKKIIGNFRLRFNANETIAEADSETEIFKGVGRVKPAILKFNKSFMCFLMKKLSDDDYENAVPVFASALLNPSEN